MATDTDTLAGDANQGATDPQAGDYASLLDASEDLNISDPDQDDAADAESPEEAEEVTKAEKADGQDVVTDDAKVAIDGREVTISELKETFTTFQRKAQEYAEVDQQREVQARTAIAETQEQAAQQIAALANGINDLVLPGVDMQAIARLRFEDPVKAGELLTTLQIVERFKADMLEKAGQVWAQAQAQRKAADEKSRSAQEQLLASERDKLAGEKWFTDDFRIKARSFLKANGIPESFANSIPYAGAMRIIKDAMDMQAARAKLKAGKQPSQQAQVPASGRPRDANQKQRSDQLFVAARKNPSDRRTSARAYSSLLGD